LADTVAEQSVIRTQPPTALSATSYIIVKKTSQFKTVCKDDSGYITQLKQQKSKR